MYKIILSYIWYYPMKNIIFIFNTIICSTEKYHITKVYPPPPSSCNWHHPTKIIIFIFKLTIEIIQQKLSFLVNVTRRHLWGIDNSDLFKINIYLGSLRIVICLLAVNGPHGFDGPNEIEPWHKRGNFPWHKRITYHIEIFIFIFIFFFNKYIINNIILVKYLV